MTYCCLIPFKGPDRFVAVRNPQANLIHCGTIYHRTVGATHGGWPIYFAAGQVEGHGGGDG